MKKSIQPYLIIAICGILAFAPVSFMLRALKNDIMAFEYPINHFISQCIRHGELPIWFNTWGMGFPLESIITGGVFSTPRLLFSLIFNYNIYTLHVEFMFYILLSGWGMYNFLKNYLCRDERSALMLSISYMLSGFTVGSSQWLLYITTAAFVPMIVVSLLKLLYSPSFGNALQFAIIYFLMFTSVYPAFTIITTYSLIFLAIIFIWNNRHSCHKRIKYLFVAATLTLLLCLPGLYYTVELLNNIERGKGLETDKTFFYSNYLHPGALYSMLFPLSSVKMEFENTEGTMMHSYAGIFTLLLVPFAIRQTIQTKNKLAAILLFASLFFLLSSFGHLTPLRQWLNLLPGFAYFRHPGIFRFYFLFTIIIFLAASAGKYSLDEILKKRNTLICLGIVMAVYLVVALTKIPGAGRLFDMEFAKTLQTISFSHTLLISALIQLTLLACILYFIYRRKMRLVTGLFAADVIINTLICTPFYTVSSLSPSYVNSILKPVKGFPVQNTAPSEVSTTVADFKGNYWQNKHIFSKQVSSQIAHYGPLILKKSFHDKNTAIYKNKPLVFIMEDTVSAKVDILLQRPAHVRALVNVNTPCTVVLLQNYYKGWKAFINNKEAKIVKKQRPGIAIMINEGTHTVDFRYDKKLVWILALLLHMVVICFAVFRFIYLIRRLYLS